VEMDLLPIPMNSRVEKISQQCGSIRARSLRLKPTSTSLG
jgi:hypothetical protein